MTLIDELRAWQTSMTRALEREGISSSVTVAPRGESACLDLDSAATIGRVTVWSRGMCDVEVLAVESGDQLVWQHFEEITATNLGAAPELALKHMRVHGAAS